MAASRRMVVMVALLMSVPAGMAQELIEDRPVIKQLSATEVQARAADEPHREARAIFALGVMRHRSDRWLDAVGLLEEAARLDAAIPATPRALVPLYLSLAREDDALDCCRKVLKLDPADAETAWQLAKLQKSQGQTAEAIATLKAGVASPRLTERPDLHYFMLLDLTDQQEKAADYTAAAASYRKLAAHLLEHRARLVGSDTLTLPAHGVATARAYEKVGQCLLELKQHNEAIKAFVQSRDTLASHPDPDTKAKAVRLNWNLARVCLARERWEDAAEYLDEYLEALPSDPEPYEKKLLTLAKLRREADMVPTLKKWQRQMPDAIGVQLLVARELGQRPAERDTAEKLMAVLVDRFGTPDVFRVVFAFHEQTDTMSAALDLIDSRLGIINSKDEVPADVRDHARERTRAILNVLRNNQALMLSLVRAGAKELHGTKARSLDTWQFLGALAIRVRQYEKAEDIFRYCLPRVPVTQEIAVYSGLLDSLFQQHKTDDVIALCKDVIDGSKKAAQSNELLFRRSLALAHADKEQYDEAVAECDKAIKLTPAAGVIFERCRKARILARAERWDAAIAECEGTLKEALAAGEIKQARYTYAAIHTLRNEHEKSEALLMKILADDPNDPGANNDLGYQWADRNHNLTEAERMIRKAVEVDRLQRRDDPEGEPDNAAYLDSLGWVLYRLEKLDEARDWLEKAAALRVGADDPTVWDHLGDVYSKLKQHDKAKQSWQTSIKLYEKEKRDRKDGKVEEVRKKLKLASE